MDFCFAFACLRDQDFVRYCRDDIVVSSALSVSANTANSSLNSIQMSHFYQDILCRIGETDITQQKEQLSRFHNTFYSSVVAHSMQIVDLNRAYDKAIFDGPLKFEQMRRQLQYLQTWWDITKELFFSAKTNNSIVSNTTLWFAKFVQQIQRARKSSIEQDLWNRTLRKENNNATYNLTKLLAYISTKLPSDIRSIVEKQLVENRGIHTPVVLANNGYFCCFSNPYGMCIIHGHLDLEAHAERLLERKEKY